MSKFSTERDGRGTKEWSDASYNICLGCQHGCLYCYAKAQRCRFDESVRLPGGWDAQRLNPNRDRYGAELGPVGKGGKPGVVMFPTSHDLTPQFLPESLQTIKNLLVNDQVLIVSKPHAEVVKKLCKELADHKDDIMFRFTIGALSKTLCQFWEPGAPTPAERIRCLQYAHRRGFATSVSIEPMLVARSEIVKLVARVEPFVTDTIWVGKVQRMPRKYNAHVVGFDQAAALIKAQQTDAEILKLVDDLEGNPKVRWKDSIKEVLARRVRS